MTSLNEPLALIFGLLNPLLEMIVLVLLLMPGLGRRNAQHGPHFGLLWIGMLLIFLADARFSLEGVNDTYQAGQSTDLLYTWGCVTFALAAHAKLHFRLPAQRFSRNAQLSQLAGLFPYTAALVGMIALGQQFGRKDLTALGVLIGNGLTNHDQQPQQAVAGAAGHDSSGRLAVRK